MVHKALDQSIVKQTSILDFKVCGLQTLRQSNIYTTLGTSENEEGE
jgi:hypothetical protein